MGACQLLLSRDLRQHIGLISGLEAGLPTLIGEKINPQSHRRDQGVNYDKFESRNSRNHRPGN